MNNEMDEFQHADIPEKLKTSRACLRCSLIKSFDQFYERGCENCDFLGLENNPAKIQVCTTAYFEGMIAVLEPESSWVARWQRIAKNVPGLYAIEVAGVLPEDMVAICEDMGVQPRPQKS